MKDLPDNTYHILAVDDSEFMLRLVERPLTEAGFKVTIALSGEEALEQIERHGLPHLAVVDINMPMGIDGFEFCRTVLAYCDLPIIMLTAVNEEGTIIEAIEQYAEDYMTKPFNAGELVARVKRVLRRVGDFAYTFDPITTVDERLAVDFPHQKVMVENEAVSLTPTETKLLYILMRNAGRTVTTDFILRRLWPLETAYEDRLRVYVHRLRRKIEVSPEKPHYIQSRRGTGYSFWNSKTKA